VAPALRELPATAVRPPIIMKKLEATLVSLLYAGLAIGGVTYGARTWLPHLASRHGAGIDSMLHYLLVTVGVLFLTGYLVLAYFIWRGVGRRVIGPRFARPRVEFALSAALGLGMAIVAEGGVIAIGMPVWREYFDATPPADATMIEVTAQQFMWNVRYPGPDGTFGRTEPRLIDDTANPIGIDPSDPAGKDDVLTLNEIAVPFGKMVRIRLRSKDVIHSFFLPNFRVKQDAVPGMSPEVVFFPTETGTFEIACAELCGLAHYRMRGFFKVLPPREFAEWMHQQQETAPAPVSR
jgi:cytochrome c oxidase subunit 2